MTLVGTERVFLREPCGNIYGTPLLYAAFDSWV